MELFNEGFGSAFRQHVTQAHHNMIAGPVVDGLNAMVPTNEDVSDLLAGHVLDYARGVRGARPGVAGVTGRYLGRVGKKLLTRYGWRQAKSILRRGIASAVNTALPANSRLVRRQAIAARLTRVPAARYYRRRRIPRRYTPKYRAYRPSYRSTYSRRRRYSRF
jgi:hypothetical protein